MKISKFGILLVLIGALLIMSTYNVFSLNLSRDWPWILVIIGILAIIDSIRSSVRKNRKRTVYHSDRIDILRKVRNKEMDIDEAIDELRK